MFKAQAVILAGGLGSRLRPYTTVLPKPLMPIGEMPIAEILIRQLKHYGFKNIVISTGHLAGLIEAFFGDGRQWGVTIKYVQEDEPLGTAGALKLVKSLEDDFIVMNGDILTDIDFKELLKFHKKQKVIATIMSKQRSVKAEFGVLEISKDNILVDYIEKPETRSYVSTGINVLSKDCKQYIKKDESIGMPDLMLRMRDAGKTISCYKTTAKWLDLGRFDDLEAAQDEFERNRKKFLHLK